MTKVKIQDRRTLSQRKITNLFFLVAAGGLIGVTAGLLMAPKAGRKIRRELFNTYEDLADKGQELAQDLVEKGSEYVNNIRSSEEKTSNTTLLIGVIGGGLLGAAAAYIFTREPSEPEGITDRFRAAGRSAAENLRSINWFETAKEILEAMSEKASHHHNGSKVAEDMQHNFNEVLKWANLGLSVWQNLQKRS